MGFALAAASLVGAAVSAYGSYEQGQANAAAANYQAQVARNNAVIAEQNVAWTGESGAAKESAQGMKNAAAVGNLKAKQGASGIDINTGSSANVRAAAAELGELDLGTTRSNTSREAYGYEVAATGDTAQAQLLQTEASNYASAAPISALGTFLTGASSVGSKYSSWGGGGSSGAGSGVFSSFPFTS